MYFQADIICTIIWNIDKRRTCTYSNKQILSIVGKMSHEISDSGISLTYIISDAPYWETNRHISTILCLMSPSSHTVTHSAIFRINDLEAHSPFSHFWQTNKKMRRLSRGDMRQIKLSGFFYIQLFLVVGQIKSENPLCETCDCVNEGRKFDLWQQSRV